MSRFGLLPPLLALWVLTPLASAGEVLVTVPEMQPLERRLGQLEEVSGLTATSEKRAIEAVRKRVHERWSRIRDLDVHEISRYQREATEGYRLPIEPGPLPGRILGRQSSGQRLVVELRGPALPSHAEIVERHLVLYGVFDPLSGVSEPLVVTIRGRVLE